MSVVDVSTDAAATLGRLRSRPRRGTARGAVRRKGTRTGRLALVCAEGGGRGSAQTARASGAAALRTSWARRAEVARGCLVGVGERETSDETVDAKR